MGFDLYSKEDKNLSIQYNVWSYHPMWYFCYKNGWIDDEQYSKGKENSGFVINAETTSRLAREITIVITKANLEQIIKETNKEFNRKVENFDDEVEHPSFMFLRLCGRLGNVEEPFKFNEEHIRRFRDFCSDAGSFEIC